ncbi:hypothetical protein K432DRAFT_383211 [Lepidopterella palustris CBS 459.81]|uniref:FAR1 domain-containing protein n=1 Tax=Lepidopterella palustris CBS 459.81 TaxID=1314670 RepID=A0A8E2E8F7_9PEZI|nr:hypothetical protein K432DRAFT_383211 [Lepidopterella palustris CBS 459.81]
MSAATTLTATNASSLHHDANPSPYPPFPTTDPSLTDVPPATPYHPNPSHSSTHAENDHNPNLDPSLTSPAPHDSINASATPSTTSLRPVAQTNPHASSDFDMAPPPQSTHASFTALHTFAQSHAAEHGYALSINTTAKNRSRIKLACVCYGHAKNTHKLTPETRVRKNRQSCKTGCKMWVEGKRQEDGTWMLRVGEAEHNHEGRGVEGWAVQRKRTWGVSLGRIGVGGVTAREEKEEEERRKAIASGLEQSQAEAGAEVEGETAQDSPADPVHDQAQDQPPSHSHESGGLVWQIVEQEMARKGGPGQGRDRGVGRTVKVLQDRLPGIRIFKRDVYNIRAQIKRARKSAGEEVGEGMMDDADMMLTPPSVGIPEPGSGCGSSNRFPEIDPLLVAQCNDALRNVGEAQESEVERLRRENEELRVALGAKGKDAEEKAIENQRLKVELEMVRLEVMYNRQHRRDGMSTGGMDGVE